MNKNERATLKNNFIEALKDNLENRRSFYFTNYEEAMTVLDKNYLETIKGEDLSHQYLGKIFSEIANIYGYQYEKLVFDFQFNIADITGWEKDKNILKLFFKYGAILNYDFNTQKLSSSAISFSSLRDCEEWVFNYADLLPENFRTIMKIAMSFKDVECPKGFINWLKENNLKLKLQNYYTFKITKEHPDFSKRIFAKALLESTEYQRGLSPELIEYIENAKVIDKMFFDENILKEIFETFFKRELRKLNEMKNANFTIDTNRGISQNYKLYNDWLTEKENKEFAKKLQVLNFLNNVEFDKYIIKVPQNLEDLQKEGRNQNNCVGHYYNNSIKRGENLIYFIREKDNENKSYITARYNLDREKTVEFRRKNNEAVRSEKMINIIKNIDNFINEKLEKGKS